ncbi:MAG: hypothetical protein K2N51_10410 [Lachnospiraceae bacterium]|nr:hypothetical protein [Lachnospiraceae bacterium]
MVAEPAFLGCKVLEATLLALALEVLALTVTTLVLEDFQLRVSALPLVAVTLTALLVPTVKEVAKVFFLMEVAPTLTVKAFLPILKEALPAFKPLIVNFLPFLVTLTTFFSALERPVTLAEAETETVVDLPTPTTLLVAASALIGAAVITKAEAKRAEIAFFDFLERKLLYIK